jgi:hypothetical protein
MASISILDPEIISEPNSDTVSSQAANSVAIKTIGKSLGRNVWNNFMSL